MSHFSKGVPSSLSSFYQSSPILFVLSWFPLIMARPQCTRDPELLREALTLAKRHIGFVFTTKTTVQSAHDDCTDSCLEIELHLFASHPDSNSTPCVTFKIFRCFWAELMAKFHTPFLVRQFIPRILKRTEHCYSLTYLGYRLLNLAMTTHLETSWPGH